MSMSSGGAQVLGEALSLPPAERAELAKRLMSSLDQPSQEWIDLLWGGESEDRLDAFDRGEIKAVPANGFLSTWTKSPDERSVP
jgi:putative addiction module component (TIGR02574 family)